MRQEKWGSRRCWVWKGGEEIDREKSNLQFTAALTVYVECDSWPHLSSDWSGRLLPKDHVRRASIAVIHNPTPVYSFMGRRKGLTWLWSCLFILMLLKLTAWFLERDIWIIYGSKCHNTFWFRIYQR